jgi:zinc protease
MQVLAAYLTDPGLRPAPFQLLKSAYGQQLIQARATPGGAFAVDGGSILSSGDARDALPRAEMVEGWTNDQLKAELAAGLAAGPVSITMVGDLTVEDAIASVASTFGALPPRGPEAQPLPGSDQKRFPAPTGQPIELTHTGPAEQALAIVAWPTTDAVGDRTEARQLSILSQVLRLRVLEEIREKQALAYSPGVGAQSSDVFPDYGFMLVQGETARASIPAFYAAVEQIAATLRDAPPEEDELNRAKLPAIERLRLSQATNEYWLAQLADVAEDPSEIAQTVNHIAVLEAVTPADIQRLAQKYLSDSAAVKVQVVSANPEAAPAGE